MNTSDPCEIVSTRLIDAPRDKVFRAYEDGARISRWWGPNGFTSTLNKFDFRPAGEWNFIFHGPDGKNYINAAVWREIDKPSRLVLEHTTQPHFTLTMTLEDVDGKTRLTWRQRFDTPQIRDQLAPVCEPSNEQNFDRLQAELALVP